MIIDTHVHVWDRNYPSRPYPWTPDPHPQAALEAAMTPIGIDRACLVTPLIEGWDNSCSFETAARGAGRFRVYGRFDIFADDPYERLTALMTTKHAAGVRLTPFGAERVGSLLDGRAREFWRAAAELGVRVCAFVPDDLGLLLDVLHEEPELRLVVDHFGLGVYDGCRDPLLGLTLMPRFAEFPQVLAKLSGIPEVSAEAFPFDDVAHVVASAVEWFGVDRLIWGSNYPVVLGKCSYEASLRYLDVLPVLTPDEVAAVVGGNALQLGF